MTEKVFYEKYGAEIAGFLGKKGIKYLKENNFDLAFGAVLYGRVGAQIRNHLREKFPELLDKHYLSFQEFEDLSYYVTKRIVHENLDN